MRNFTKKNVLKTYDAITRNKCLQEDIIHYMDEQPFDGAIVMLMSNKRPPIAVTFGVDTLQLVGHLEALKSGIIKKRLNIDVTDYKGE